MSATAIHEPKPADPGHPGLDPELPTKPAFAERQQFSSSALSTLLTAIVLLLPFWAVPLSHLAVADGATGFFHYELPYYIANGRAAFERGDGLFYPNPYDPSPTAPAIYVHWLPWLLGWLTVQLQWAGGDLILMLTCFAALAFALTTRMLVRQCLGRPQSGQSELLSLAWLMAMWGGGLFSLAAVLFGSSPSPESWAALLQFDPGRGWWFLNWGRNAVFPTEAVYHSLVALCWWAELRRRRLQATGWLLLLATTHPWSGLELLLTINLWRALRLLRVRDRSTIGFSLAAAAVLAGFLGYYKVWLPRFPQHARLQQVWELDWSLTWTTAALAYSLVAVPCLLHLRDCLQRRWFSRQDAFLLCALAVAVCLAFHDRVIAPVQPLHFTRGYIWMPLFLLGLPKLSQWWQQLQSGFSTDSAEHSDQTTVPAPRIWPKLLAAAALTLLCLDNAVFSWVHSQRQLDGQDGFRLTVDERALLASLGQECPAAVLLTDSAKLNYLAPACANLRPWLGHQFNTPDFPDRQRRWSECFPEGRVAAEQIPAAVQVLAIRRDRDATSLVRHGHWVDLAVPNAGWRVWLRVPE